jgi:hypothetical protein
MNTQDRLTQWRESGKMTAERYDPIRALVRKDRSSLFLELNVLLYLGVLALAGGIAATVQKYFASLSDIAVLMALTVLFTGSLFFCFRRATPFSKSPVESPTITLDYVLYFSCLVMSTELTYIEYRYSLLNDQQDLYFLFGAIVFFVLAYRFDNRFVLSLALSALATTFGLRFTRFHMISNVSLRVAGIGYSILVSATGLWLNRIGLKKHFLQTYLHIATNVLLMSLLSGVVDRDRWPGYIASLMIAAGVAIYCGVHFRRFAFTAYGVLYGYAGFSMKILDNAHDAVGALLYIVTTGFAVILGLVVFARRFGRDE